MLLCINLCTVKPDQRHLRYATRRSTVACLTSRVIQGAEVRSVTVRVARGHDGPAAGANMCYRHRGGQLNQTEW